MMVAKTKRNDKDLYEPYMCVVYNLDGDNLCDNVMNIEPLPHGNSKGSSGCTQPYQRTLKSVLNREDELLNCKKPNEVYDYLFEECGGALLSPSISCEPRNIKQIQNRQSLKQKKVSTQV